MKKQSSTEIEDFKNENNTLRDKISLLLQERMASDNTIKAIRKTNSDLNNALNRANL